MLACQPRISHAMEASKLEGHNGFSLILASASPHSPKQLHNPTDDPESPGPGFSVPRN